MLLKTAKIKTLEDIKGFLAEMGEMGLVFHPDTPFEDYIDTRTKKHTFSTKEAWRLNSLLDDCFTVCSKQHVDFYSLNTNKNEVL